MLGGMVESDPPHDPFGFSLSEYCDERVFSVGVEVIQYHMDASSPFIPWELADPPDLTGKVGFCATFRGMRGAVSRLWLHRHEYIGRTISDVLVV